MTSHDTELALSAVHTYFNGERRELLIMAVGAVMLILAAALLGGVARDGFARGLFAVVLIFGTLFGGGAASLLVRDIGLRSDLVAAMASHPKMNAARATLEEEKSRVTIVLSKFSLYRIAALAIAVVALGGLLFFDIDWIQGAAAGLLLVAASQAIIDHFSESRATIYLQRLHALPAL